MLGKTTAALAAAAGLDYAIYYLSTNGSLPLLSLISGILLVPLLLALCFATLRLLVKTGTKLARRRRGRRPTTPPRPSATAPS